MAFESITAPIENSPLGTWMRESTYAFPLVESFHVLALVVVVGSIMLVDLRLLGVTNRKHPFTRLSGDLLPFTWGAFVVAVISGSLMVTGQAGTYANNTMFRLKLLVLALAGLNMVIFHFLGARNVAGWDDADQPPVNARLSGALSLIFWVTIVALGRWIGFTADRSFG